MTPSVFVNSRSLNLLACFLIAVPFIAYYLVLNHYLSDIPVLDDYVNPLDMTNKAITAATLQEKFIFLATPMNGHIPFLPRVLLYIQYLAGATSALRSALFVSNFGWMATALLLVIYCHRHYQISLPYLIPIPFFLLSIAHWEAMDFYSSAFQMYWGSGLLAVAGLIAITANKPILASFCFLAGLFCSGGTLAVYPICFLFFLLTRQWKIGLLFLLYTIPVYWLYTQVYPPSSNLHKFPDIGLLALYVLEFISNLFSTGKWDITAYTWHRYILGSLMIVAMIYLSWRVKEHYALKLIFFYVLLLGIIAGYARLDLYNHAVSRYAMYAALAAVCIYTLLVVKQVTNPTLASKAMLVVVGLLSVGIWIQSLLLCREPLQINLDQKITGMRNYILSGDPNSLLSWNAQHAKGVLDVSKKIGLYDYTKSIN